MSLGRLDMCQHSPVIVEYTGIRGLVACKSWMSRGNELPTEWFGIHLLGQLVSINPPMSTLCLSPNMSDSTRSCPEWQLHV